VVFERGSILADGSRNDFVRSLRAERMTTKEPKATSSVAAQQATNSRYTINWQFKK
jgi:hypothetical protein